MTDIKKIEAEIKMLQSKLELYKELEKTKSPVEQAYKDAYGKYPVKVVSEELTSEDNWNVISWNCFQKGYISTQKDYKVGEYREPEKVVVPLYYRFRRRGWMLETNALQVVREFLLDEAFIEGEDEEYVTLTLKKSLLEVPND